ncbi:MAG: response regulator [Desulfobacteraceae bacterium]|nr:response regulator [Desulfobacteraceae bacterium]
MNDRMAMIHTVGRMLAALGYRVEPACGALAALHLLRKSIYDLVVTDLKIAHMDGFSLSAWVKSRFEDTRVIVMIDLVSAEVDLYMRAGVVDRWLFKPFRTEDLVALLREMILVPPCMSGTSIPSTTPRSTDAPHLRDGHGLLTNGPIR